MPDTLVAETEGLQVQGYLGQFIRHCFKIKSEKMARNVAQQ